MFGAINAKWTGFGQVAPRSLAVVIPLDRPDLMADAGYEGLRYRGPASRADTRPSDGRDPGRWRAAWWMPFHAAAG
jgi:hypothetical protein